LSLASSQIFRLSVKGRLLVSRMARRWSLVLPVIVRSAS
jgi:hypothetical protein